ncbi:NADP-dependent oxidoreductase domain-containing protein [Dioszegia hungarica]|uniref:NADP-dependent oxidoreductase domain-containing protein n=1 Tax=Dioszegia hungarica TaxID=4972 RepID=A0AA38LQZ1_9TREE|nr:NADP-dependent oxidoreductase domain-containing protein [Dioszegia hungarica]KAI9632188.1 NADP-dependent oxidoreductase domain-containing protein [Dioszegia hungarica]
MTTKMLNDGTVIPLLAYGTATVHNNTDPTPSILLALQKGFRHVETARVYGNESFIKSAIEQWEGGGREDVFIQSNWGETSAVGYEHDPERSLMETLTLLGTEYLDMYLIHGPNLMYPLTLVEAWQKMEDFHARGLVRSIGLSNFPAEEIEELSRVWKVKPSVNQVEYHPYCYRLPRMQSMLALCHSHDIAVQPFTCLAPLTRWPGGPAEVAAREVAEKKGAGVSAAQVLLVWARQMTGGPLLTTCKKEHQYEEIFDSLSLSLSPAEMELISAAGRSAPQKRRYALKVWGDAASTGYVR